MRYAHWHLGINFKSFGPQPSGNFVLVAAFVKQLPEMILRSVGATHDGIVDLLKLLVGDASEIKAALNGHHGGLRLGNRMADSRMKTYEIRLAVWSCEIRVQRAPAFHSAVYHSAV